MLKALACLLVALAGLLEDATLSPLLRGCSRNESLQVVSNGDVLDQLDVLESGPDVCGSGLGDSSVMDS